MRTRLLSLAFCLLLIPVFASAQGLDTTKLDQVLGRSGQKTGNVYRVGFPRTDLHVSVAGVELRPGLALGSWAAFSGSDEHAMVMGDLVLLEKEVTPVMQKLRSANFEITAVHNHLQNETPRILYMHYMGRGPASTLATSLRLALGASQTPMEKPAPAQASEPASFVKKVEDTIGAKGSWNGGVLAFGIPRGEPVTEDGMTLTGPQGVAESINFQEAGTGKVATTGDFVLIASEVNPVISALAEHNIEVTALHSHMLTEEPRLFFMHFWSVGPPETVAEGIKAALDKVHINREVSKR